MSKAVSFAQPLLVADVGGTNARFALAGRDAAGAVQLQHLAELRAADFATLALAAQHYLSLHRQHMPQRAVFAVASAVAGDRIQFTNSPWTFSTTELQRKLQLSELLVINDFAAIGHAAAVLAPADLHRLGSASAPAGIAADGRYVVLGPGTGLGVCGLLRQGGRSIVLETEGGHVGFAPADARERQVLEILQRRFSRVSAERLLSGPGLMNLHAALCELAQRHEAVATPAEISAMAARAPDSVSAEAVACFAAMLGGFAGDMVLAHGAWSGVYLAGGITAHLLPAIEAGGFLRRFEAKGRFETLLKQVPVHAIVHPQPGLLGAAALGLQQL